MQRYGNIVKYTVEEIEAMRSRGEIRHEWARVDAVTPGDVERLADEDDEMLRGECSVYLDPGLRAFFRPGEPGFQERVEAVLRAYVASQPEAGETPVT